MNYSKLTSALIASLIFIGANAQTYYHKTGKEKIAGDQAYVLPKAVLVIEIPVITTEVARTNKYVKYTEGQLKTLKKKYGVDPETYLSLADDKNQKITTVKISDDSIKISAQAAPDYTKVFYVKSASKWNKNQIVTFTYGTDGIITDAESSIEDKTFDIGIKAIGGLVSIAGNLFRSGDDQPVTLTPLAANDDVVIKPLDDILLEFKKIELQSDFEIYKDLKAKYEKKYAEQFAELFYSEKKKITITKLFYTPGDQTKTDTDIDLFYLNASDKLIVNTNLSSELWSRDLTLGTVPSKKYRLQFKAFPDQQKDHFEARTDEQTGIGYNIPLKAALSLYNADGKIVCQEIIKVPQLGIVGYTNTRKQKLTYSLDPLTGELKKLSIEGKAVLVDQVGSVATTVTDATNTIKGDDADAKLDKEVKRLENEKKKKDLLKALEE